MVVAIASVVFFLAFGISHFIPFSHSGDVIAIAALVVGVAGLISLIKR